MDPKPRWPAGILAEIQLHPPAMEIAMGTPITSPAIIMQQLRKSVYATEYNPPKRAVTTMTPKAIRVPIFSGTPRMEFRMSPTPLYW